MDYKNCTIPITLDIKDRIDDLRKCYSHKLASHSFVSLFLWKDKQRLSVGLEEEGFVVKCDFCNDNTYYFPCGSDRMKRKFIDYAITNRSQLIYVSEEDKKFLEDNYRGHFKLEPEPEAYEYVYGKEEYDLLKGKTFSKIRNLINSINNKYQVRIEEINSKNMKDAISVFDTYSCTRGTEIDGFSEDVSRNLVIRYKEELGMTGIIIYLDGKAEAVSFNYPLTENILDGCVEAHNHNINGLFCYVIQATILHSDNRFKFLNAEEDLGLEGLRNIKSNMKPQYMNYIWKANTNYE